MKTFKVRHYDYWDPRPKNTCSVISLVEAKTKNQAWAKVVMENGTSVRITMIREVK